MVENSTPLPSVEDMEQKLEDSGKLLNEIPTGIAPNKPRVEPLSSLQPENMVQTDNGPQPMIINSQQAPQTTDIHLATTYRAPSFDFSLLNWIHKPLALIIALVLTLQGLYGIYDSIKFLMVDYPQLEALLRSHQIEPDKVIELVLKTTVLLVAALVGMVFSLRLMKRNETQFFNILLGSFFIFLTFYLQYVVKIKTELAILIPTVTAASSGNILLDWLNQFSL